MADVTIQDIAKVIKAELEPVNIKLAAIEEIVSGHTEILNGHTKILDGHASVLDGIARETHALLAAKVVSEYRMEKIEHWAKEVGEKVGVKLEL